MSAVVATVAQLFKRTSVPQNGLACPTRKSLSPPAESPCPGKDGPPDIIRLMVDLEDVAEDDSICCPRNCSHCARSPPSLIYSSESCSSLALTHSDVGTPLFEACFDSPALCSPQGMLLSDGTPLLPLPELDVVNSTIAQRRGVKQPPALRPTRPTSSHRSSMAPATPDTIAQRLVGFMRLSSRPEPIAEEDAPDQRVIVVDDDDPFGRTAGSYYAERHLFDASELNHPDMYDLAVYTHLPMSLGAHYYTERCPMHGKARLYIGVSETRPPSTSSTSNNPIDSPPSRASRRTSFSPRSYSASAPSPPLQSPRSPLRPLLLAQKFPTLAIADAQAESILTSTPKLRPLLLPQHVARRRASFPSRASSPSPHPKSNPNANQKENPNARRRRRYACARYAHGFLATLEEDEDELGEGEGSEEGGCVLDSGSGSDEGGGLQQQQLDGILSLLDQSGVIDHDTGAGEGDGAGADASMVATSGSASSESEDSVLSSVTRAPAPEQMLRTLSRKVEDILELLASPTTESASGVPERESLVGREAGCVYAL